MARSPKGGTVSFSADFGTPIAFSFGDNGERSDFRQVPASDRGDESYSDRGQLGSWGPSEPYPVADGIRFFSGYGAETEDLERGYCAVGVSEDPAYDKENYRERMSQPRHPMEDQGDRQVMERDWEFRGRNRRAKGFLTRPYIPTER
jgi:hypothetical protein